MSRRPRPAVSVAGSDRNRSLDVIRGVALLGVLVVNIQPHLGTPATPVDVAAVRLVTTFALSKFYPLFALLFGIGLALQWARWGRATGGGGVSLCVRRLVSLYVIGVAFYILIDANHILLSYAILGWPVLAVRSLPVRTVVAMAGVSLALAIVYPAGRLAAQRPDAGAAIEGSVRAGRAPDVADGRVAREEWHRAQRERSYGGWIRMRVGMYQGRWTAAPPATLLHLLALCLLGTCAVKSGLFDRYLKHSDAARLRQAANRLLLAGAIGVLAPRIVAPAAPSAASVLLLGGVSLLGGTLLALGYAAGILVLARVRALSRAVDAVACAGRMSLTNFICQSVVMNGLFHGYGLGFEGLVTPLWGCGLALAIWLAQAAVSVVVLKYCSMGPAEWVWRFAVYGVRKPLRRTQAACPV